MIVAATSLLGAQHTPSPLTGEGWGEGEEQARISAIPGSSSGMALTFSHQRKRDSYSDRWNVNG